MCSEFLERRGDLIGIGTARYCRRGGIGVGFDELSERGAVIERLKDGVAVAGIAKLDTRIQYRSHGERDDAPILTFSSPKNLSFAIAA